MVRIPLYAIIPYLIVCLTFNTAYADLFIMAVMVFTATNLIRKKRVGISVVVAVFTVIAYLNCFNAYSVDNKPAYNLIGQEITLKCVVDDMPKVDDGSMRFTAKTVSAEINGETITLGEKISVFTDTTTSIPKYGDLLEFQTKIKLPSTAMNIGGVDYKNYLNAKGIHFLCNTNSDDITNHGKYDKVNPVLYNINLLRSNLAGKCDSYMSKDAASFTKAFVLGYKGDMSEEMKNAFSGSGISHIVAVSGLHLSIMIAIINLLVCRLKLKKRVYIIPALNIVCSLFIMAFTGFSPSVVRAAVMLIISNSAALAKRESDSLQSLSFAFLIILLINPLAVHDIGLILSVAATLSIILFGEKISRYLKNKIKIRFIRDTLAITLAAQVFTLPFMIIYFNSFSLFATITNMLIVPTLPFLMGLIIAFLICPVAPLCWFMANGVWLWVSFILKISEFIASVPYAKVCIGFGKFCYMAVLSVCALWFIRKTITTISAKKNFIYFAISCLAVVLLIFPPTSKNVKISAINTGYSDCTLIQLPQGRTMLIDGGDAEFRDSANEIIIPYLLQNGIHKIDYAVISDFTENSTKGIISLANNFDVRCILVPQYIPDENKDIADKVFRFCEEKNIELHMLEEGDTFFPADGVIIDIYSPKKHYTYEANDGSLVFELSAYGRSILFTGNIGSKTKTILTEFRRDINADIIKLPNHNYNPDEDKNFLDMVNPMIAYVFTDNNIYREKQRENTSKNLTEKGILTYMTSDMGTIRLTIKPDGNIYIR